MHADNAGKPMSYLPLDDLPKLLKMVEEGYLHPILDHARWAEFAREVRLAPDRKILFRMKKICDPRRFFSRRRSAWQHDVATVDGMEWVELKTSSPEWVMDRLRHNAIPFSIEKDVIRVWVYVRAGIQPEWHD